MIVGANLWPSLLKPGNPDSAWLEPGFSQNPVGSSGVGRREMEDREGSSTIQDPVGFSAVGGREVEDREGSSRVENPVGSSGVGERKMEDREESSRVEDPVNLLARVRWKTAEDLPGGEDLDRSSGER